MSRLAVLTFAVLRNPEAHPASQAFLAEDPQVFAAAAHAAGFLGHSGHPDDPDGPASGGAFARPRVAPAAPEAVMPQTLSLSASPEALEAFADAGRYGAALTRRRDWFAPGPWPSHVVWWVSAAETPTGAEGCAHLERLHAEAPSATAFPTGRPFAPDGTPRALDRERIATLAGRNAALA